MWKHVFHCFDWVSCRNHYLFSKFLHLCKIGPILLQILLVGPRKCIQDIISTVEDFCGIPDLKTRISLFWMSFMAKTLPNFSKFLHIFKIGRILPLILWGLQSVSKTKFPQWKTFVGSPIWKHVFHCFEWVSGRKHYLIFRISYVSAKLVLYCYWFSLGDLESVSKT